MKSKIILSAITLSILSGCASTYTPQPAPQDVANRIAGMPVVARMCKLEPHLIAELDGAAEYSKSTWKSEPVRYNTLYGQASTYANENSEMFTKEYCRNFEIAVHSFINEGYAHKQQAERNAQIARENQRQLNQDMQQLNRDMQQMNRDNMQIYQNMQRNNRQCLTNSFTGITTCV